VLKIKTDAVDSVSRTPIVRAVIARSIARLGSRAHVGFEGNPLLVPVPRSSLTKPNTVWPARRVCEELLREGFGEDLVPLLIRQTAIPKSAGNTERLTLAVQVRSLAVQRSLAAPHRLVLVDDVITSGTTMMACALRLARSFPGVPISGFALARVQSQGDPAHVLDPAHERIVIGGKRCSRRVAPSEDSI
jgi:predicted amidophosphoribosyltransferase